VGEGIPEIFSASGEDIFGKSYNRTIAELKVRNIGLNKNVILVPYKHTGWTMFGGSYAMTSDSRFVERIRHLLDFDFYGAIPVHDWTEDKRFMR
jgi:hypothetical protein